jgi:hypothetical protein
MTAQIQTNPKTVSLFGDSYSSGHIDKPQGMAYSPLSSIGAGSAGDFIVLEGRSWGGMSAADAVNDTGPWLNDLRMGGTFAFCAPYDVARYQVFRYGINEAVRKNADDTYTHCLQCFEANLHNLVDASRAAGRIPVLCTPPVLPVNGIMTTECVARLADATDRIRAVASSKNVPLVDQSNWSFTVAQMADPYHPSAAKMHALNMDLGVKLRQVISAAGV